MIVRGHMMRNALLLGTACLVASLVGACFDSAHFFRAYLFAWLCCLAVALGALGIVMLNHLTGGGWGLLVGRIGEQAAMTLPLLAVAFVPLALGMKFIFPWARPDEVAASALLKHRQVGFAPWMVLLRAAIYFALWTLLAWRLRGLSLARDRDDDPALAASQRWWSAVGMLIYFATMSLAAFDWIASREVDWFSSTFGWAVIVGQSVSGLSFILIVVALRADRPEIVRLAVPDVLHDLGNLLQTIVVLWAYVAFAQYLVIWIGNTQEDITWFYHRAHRGWQWVGTALIVLHFACPFALLLFQRVKRNLKPLVATAAGVLFMRLVDALWMIAPSTKEEQPRAVHWMDPVMLVALGGLWFAAFLWLLRRNPIVAIRMTPVQVRQSVVNEHGPQSRTSRSTG